MIPGVKGQPATREEAQAFHESERNCNTCARLSRVKQPKQTSGLYAGNCLSVPVDHPYPVVTEDSWFRIQFAPDDWMGMKCWEPRPSTKPTSEQP